MSSKMAKRLLLLAAFAVMLATVAACGGGGGGDDSDPESFAEFAEKIARAAEDGDTAFFIDRVKGDTLTCTENIAAEGRCTEVGAQFEQLLITHFAVSDVVAPTEELTTDIEAFFRLSEPDEEDAYGTGAVRLFATALRQPFAGSDETYKTAILTGILSTSPVGGRFARGLDFEYLDGRWMIRSAITANPPVSLDLLAKASAEATYLEWTAY